MKKLFGLLFFAALSNAALGQTLKIMSYAHTDYSAMHQIVGESKSVFLITFNNQLKTVRVQGNNQDSTLLMVSYTEHNATSKNTNVDWKVKHDKITGYSLVTQDPANVYLLEKYKDGKYRKYTRLSTLK